MVEIGGKMATTCLSSLCIDYSSRSCDKDNYCLKQHYLQYSVCVCGREAQWFSFISVLVRARMRTARSARLRLLYKALTSPSVI